LYAAVLQDPASAKLDSGLEHQLPHLYSQLGVGDTTEVDVHSDGLGDELEEGAGGGTYPQG
jgi:hypothetical protein